jgi:hypothetical protein
MKRSCRALQTRRAEVFLASRCGIEFDDGKRRMNSKSWPIRRPVNVSVGDLSELKADGKIGTTGRS